MYGPVSPNFCARRSVIMILNLSESLAKPLVMNMAYSSSLNKRAKTAVVLTISGTPCPRHFTVPFWCRSTFGPRGPGLCPNPATSRDFALYMTMKYAVIRKRCLNHAHCLTVYCRTFPFWEHPISAKLNMVPYHSVIMILNLRITCQAACHGETEHEQV